MATEIKKRKVVDSTSTWIRELGLQQKWHLHCTSGKEQKLLLAHGAIEWTFSVDPATQPHPTVNIKTESLLGAPALANVIILETQTPLPVGG